MERSCEELNCELTKDKSLFSTSDAVVFHHADLYSIKDYPKRFFESQKFIFYTLESPYATRAFGPENYFNWIMSYNYKSDITFTYGSKWRKCKGLCNRVPYDSSKILSTKRNRGIVGYISNCYSNSRREKIVEKLRKYIPTTIFGKCSVDRAKQKNGCKQSDYKCEEEVINSYYFYFAFENAICNNYVTEKYWSRYSFNSVPIVMKRYIYEDLNIPSSSFIAVDDFKSAKEMGDYLNYLMNNKNEYLKYFEYRNESVEVIGSDEYHFMNGFCNIYKINGTLTEYKNRFFEPAYRSRKRILLYTKVFGQSSDWTVKRCEELNCELTEDKSLFSWSDAVIFHHADLKDISNYPTRSFEKQKFVFYSLESPYGVNNFGPQNYFNWIMSYNDKADITFTYGSKWRKCNKICNHLPYNSSKILSAKTNRGIIGYISNCKTNSARLKIINALRKYVPIVFYGECALSNEPKEACKKFDYECERVVINSYYFFIAFENALCDNYITEKYWARYSFDSIPIVIKRYIYEDVGVPNNSFIAVDDFKSAKEMGDYLNYLMNDTKEYLKYFEYRNENVEVIGKEEYHLMNGFCNLCRMLHTNDRNDNEIINNINLKFTNINNCIPKNDMEQYAGRF